MMLHHWPRRHPLDDRNPAHECIWTSGDATIRHCCLPSDIVDRSSIKKGWSPADLGCPGEPVLDEGLNRGRGRVCRVGAKEREVHLARGHADGEPDGPVKAEHEHVDRGPGRDAVDLIRHGGGGHLVVVDVGGALHVAQGQVVEARGKDRGRGRGEAAPEPLAPVREEVGHVPVATWRRGVGRVQIVHEDGAQARPRRGHGLELAQGLCRGEVVHEAAVDEARRGEGARTSIPVGLVWHRRRARGEVGQIGGGGGAAVADEAHSAPEQVEPRVVRLADHGLALREHLLALGRGRLVRRRR
mmetsp:Transcript_10535/g.31372  ORF Transcript_10535/g.31372 Transcript_10535/m.31372 type:complete len:300 (-) Transcript_10535:574-1473(-)